MGLIAVEFAGERHTATNRVTFGRSADIELDTNPFMHRRVGEFFSGGDGSWWLRNVGERIHLTLITGDGKRVEMPPRSAQLLAVGTGVVRFTAGPANYELEFRTEGLRIPDRNPSRVLDEASTRVGVTLTPREVDFLVAFARSKLEGLDVPTPSYAEVAEIWGVSRSTLDNTLQSLRRKLKESRLVRDDGMATIVNLVVRHGLITDADLEWSGLQRGVAIRAESSPRFMS